MENNPKSHRVSPSSICRKAAAMMDADDDEGDVSEGERSVERRKGRRHIPEAIARKPMAKTRSQQD